RLSGETASGREEPAARTRNTGPGARDGGPPLPGGGAARPFRGAGDGQEAVAGGAAFLPHGGGGAALQPAAGEGAAPLRDLLRGGRRAAAALRLSQRHAAGRMASAGAG